MTAPLPPPLSFSQQLALWTTSLDYSKLPSEVVEKTKVLLSDYVGCCYRGMQTDSAKSCVAATAQLAGSGKATVVGHQRRRPPAWAALANGLAAHSVELDDVSAESSLHAAAVVFPASLALAG